MESSKGKTIDVVGIGNALMDLLVEVDDAFLLEHGLTKGQQHLTDTAEAEAFLQSIADKEVRTLPGGAAANTVRCLSHLGGGAAYFGAVGEGMYGSMYVDALREEGVTAHLAQRKSLTGNAITFITPDHERTFAVHLGAAAELTEDDIDASVIAAAKVVHLEAFQILGGTLPVIRKSIEAAKANGTRVSLDLNDTGLIQQNNELLRELVLENVDVLFANEPEAKAFTEKEGEAALRALAEHADISILKCGARGSLVSTAGTITAIDAYPNEVIDTTGAGDSYAAGFLYGFTRGWDTKRSGTLGALLASAVISRIGVDIEDIDVKAYFNTLDA